MKFKLNVVVTIVLVVFVLYIIYNMLSVVFNPFYREYANDQQLTSTTINANRGTVYDTNMNILAQSTTVWNVQITPSNIAKEDKELVASFLSELLKLDYNEVYEKVCQDNNYAMIAKKIDKVTADEIREFKSEHDIFAIHLIEDTKRYYPNNELACHIIGFVGNDNQGLYGVEKYYDEVLQGTPGKIMSATDAKGNAIATTYEETHDAVDGNSIVLTVDQTIQYYTEKALEVTFNDNLPAQGCCAIVMNVNTGEILAMANYPNYDLNDPWSIYTEYLQNLMITDEEPESQDESQQSTNEDKEKYTKGELQLIQWSNKAIEKAYEPGSVFKVITAASALDSGAVTMHSTFSCSGRMTVANRVMSCHNTSGHGVLDLTGAIVNSCNPAFIQIGSALGSERFSEYLRLFGITEKTGIDLNGEGQGLYISEENMGVVELASSSFGQTTTVTGIQMISAISAAVNGGYLVQPHVLKEVIDVDGNIVETVGTTIKRQVISEDISEGLNVALQAMVEANGGSTAYVQGYSIGGKSGTSQKRNQNGIYVGSFAAFAPVESPEIAVIVIVDEPTQGAYYGAAVAGPVVKMIMEDTLPYLGYSKEYTAEELAQIENSVPNVINNDVAAAKTLIDSLGLTTQVIGDGDKVIDQTPRVGSTIASGGKIILYTTENYTQQTTTVPNVVGLTPSEANRLLINAGLNVSFSGGSDGSNNTTATVTAQSVAADTEVAVGTVVQITYSHVAAD